MADVNEEFIAEYARVVGNAHIAIEDGIGSLTTPGSALFNLNQLSLLATTRLPAFGVVQTGANTGFNVTVDSSDPTFLRVSSGTIAYNGNLINVSAQRVSIKKAFAGTYSSSYVYGMRIGFPYAEAQNTAGQIYSTVLSEDAKEGDTEIYVENIDTYIELGFPLTAYIGVNTYIVFDGHNSDKSALTIDPAINGGVLSNGSTVGDVIFDSGTRVNFIYEPKVKALYGLPVSTITNDPDLFNYYPLMPSSWLPIADILIENPNSPVVATFGASDAILRTATDYPPANSATPIFTNDDAKIITTSINVAKSELINNKNRASVSDAIVALDQYTTALQDESGLTFREFWGTRPFKATTYFGKGTSFQGLERFEFSNNFSKAYFDITGQDVQRTFAIFRGDLYAFPTTIYGNAPASLTLNSYRGIGTSSSLTRGTYTYGVSAVTASGETPAIYNSVVSFDTTNSNYINELQWQSVGGALFYHIYRKSNISGEQTEYRLTSVGQVTGSGIGTTGIVGSAGTGLSTNFSAFKITTTNNFQLGGLQLRLRATGTGITNTSAEVQIRLYSNDSGTNKPNALIGSFDSIPFSKIVVDSNGDQTTSFQNFITKLDYKTTATTFWIVMKMSAQPSTGSIQVQTSASGTNAYATTTSGSPIPANWTLANNVSLHHKPLGFLDNGRAGTNSVRRGVYLTGAKTFEPRRLRIYIPEITEFPSPTGSSFTRGDIPIYGLDSTDTTETKNELIVTVVAKLGDTETTLTQTIPQGTTRGTSFLLGTEDQIFDSVSDVQVSPGANLQTQQNGAIYWSIYDMFTVETQP